MPVCACVFSLDDSYVVPFQVFFDSLCRYRSFPDRCEIVVLHTSSLSGESISSLDEFINDRGYQAAFIDATPLLPSDLPINVGDHVSASTFYRLFVADILPSDVELAVYLDSDMIALRSIRELFSLELSDSSLLGAVDHFAPAEALRIWGPCGGTYFQAGVLVIPIKRWRERSISSAFIELLTNARDKIKWWDQDVLNLVIGDKWTRLPVWFNVAHSHVSLLGQSDIEEEARLIHYSGAQKPWNAYVSSPFNYLWDSAFESLFGHMFDRESLRPPRFPRVHYYRSRLWAWIRGEH